MAKTEMKLVQGKGQTEPEGRDTSWHVKELVGKDQARCLFNPICPLAWVRLKTRRMKGGAAYGRHFSSSPALQSLGEPGGQCWSPVSAPRNGTGWPGGKGLERSKSENEFIIWTLIQCNSYLYRMKREDKGDLLKTQGKHSCPIYKPRSWILTPGLQSSEKVNSTI